MRAPPNIKKERVEGIAESDALRRFERQLKDKYKVMGLPLTQQYQVYRVRLCLKCAPEIPVSLQIFTSGTILIQGSPKIPKNEFESETDTIAEMAKQSVEIPSTSKTSPFKLRARVLLEYVSELDPNNEVERLVIVILGDIIVDLLLCEKLTQLKLKRDTLEQYIPIKLKIINSKKSVYRKKDIENLHILRNRIAHGLGLITKEEADWAKELTEDLIKNL